MSVTIETIPFRFGWRCICTVDPTLSKKDAMLFALEAFHKLPFENKLLRLEDGLTTDDGTLSTTFRGIDNKDWLLSQYLRSPICLMMILGAYKGQRMIVSIHLNRSRIVITGSNRILIDEMVDLLNLK